MEKPVRIGIVCEGPTDFEMMRAIFSAHFGEEGEAFQLRHLHPVKDATSGRSDGGWASVWRWCLRNPKRFRNTAYLSPQLFQSSEQPLDFLYFQIDTDICAELDRAGRNGTLPVPQRGAYDFGTVGGRAGYCNDTIWGWLEMETQDAAMQNRHLVGCPVEATEAWVLACLDAQGSPETDPELMKRFAACFSLHLQRRTPTSRGKFRKKVRHYREFFERVGAAVDLERGRRKASQLDRLFSNIETWERDKSGL